MTRMEHKITITSNAFLLFAKIIKHLDGKGNNLDNLQVKLEEFSNELKINLEESKRVEYLKRFASHFHNKSDSQKNHFYTKITTEIIQHNRSTFTINSKSPLHYFFKELITKKATTNDEIKKGIKEFCENYLNSFFTTETPVINEKGTSDKKGIDKDLYNTTWFFYYHEYGTITPYSTISRLVLHISDTGIVKLFERNKQDDFLSKTAYTTTGTNSSILIINLERELKTSKKKLELRIILSSGIADDSVFLGQYMDFETGDVIISGTIILQNVKGYKEIEQNENPYSLNSKNTIFRDAEINKSISYKVVQTDLVFYSDWEKYIPHEIAAYLSHKWKNFTKTKPNVATLKNLSSFLEKQGEKPYREFKFNTQIDYDIFVITPVGSLNNIENGKVNYTEINNVFFKTPNPKIFDEDDENFNIELYGATDFLKKIGVQKIYFPPRVFKVKNPDLTGEEEPHTILENDFAAMRSSRNVILIMPEKVCSSALIKVGWAMQMEKTVYVFPTKSNVLPKLLTKDYKNQIKVSKTIQVKKIPEYLKLNCSKDLKQL